jgi:outer membrane protein OmpA-like peptidoglycan-associated protein
MSNRIWVVIAALIALGLGSYWLVNKTNPQATSARSTQGASGNNSSAPIESMPAGTSVMTPAITPTATSPNPTEPAALAFMWGDAGPIESPAFVEFKKAQLAKLGTNGKLEIVGFYSAAEQAGTAKSAINLGQARAEQTAALFADSLPKERIKVSSKIVTDDAATEAAKRAGFFASVDIRNSSDAPSETVTASASKAMPSTVSTAAKPSVAPVPTPVVTPTASNAEIPSTPIRFQAVLGTRNKDIATDAYLKQVAARIRAGAQATITGYTDSQGDEALNQKLAARRATSVRTELIAMGATASRIQTAGKGSENAVGDNNTDEGRQRNRRVEISLK